MLKAKRLSPAQQETGGGEQRESSRRKRAERAQSGGNVRGCRASPGKCRGGKETELGRGRGQARGAGGNSQEQEQDRQDSAHIEGERGCRWLKGKELFLLNRPGQF